MITDKQSYRPHPSPSRELANLTKLTQTTIERWEQGELENTPFNQLLFLLTYPENVERLRAHAADHQLTAISREDAVATKVQERPMTEQELRKIIERCLNELGVKTANSLGHPIDGPRWSYTDLATDLAPLLLEACFKPNSIAKERRSL